MRPPNVIGAGAKKCGTIAFATFLAVNQQFRTTKWVEVILFANEIKKKIIMIQIRVIFFIKKINGKKASLSIRKNCRQPTNMKLGMRARRAI